MPLFEKKTKVKWYFGMFCGILTEKEAWFFMQNFIFSIFPNENFVDLGLVQYGWEQCEPAHAFGPAARTHFLFHYVISGSGQVLADDSHGVTQTYQIRSGQGFLLYPGQIATYIASRDVPWEYTWLEFDGLRVKEALEIAGLNPDAPIYRARSRELRDEMKNEMLYIVEHRDASPFHLIGHLYLFLDYLTRSSAQICLPKQSRLREFYIKEAITFIEQNFQNDISVEDIANVCGLNRSYFGKIFKNAVGKSPQDFLLNYRMIKALELLKLTKLSVTDIGNAVGYPNPLHFSRAFKNVYGISPRTWRNQNT